MKTVRMPSSFLIGPTYFIEVWYFCAKKKQKLVSSSISRHFATSCWIFTPSASRQSAVPQRDDAARFPCFATLMPDDAMTIAEVVEMLKLCALSPPVPTISSRSSSFSNLVAASRIAAAQPAISSMVSALVDFVDRAARNAAFCVALVLPAIISLMTSYASS